MGAFLSRRASFYGPVVCRDCELRAVDSAGLRPWQARDLRADSALPWNFDRYDAGTGDTSLVLNVDTSDDGERIVFIDGIKCWRLYKFGGFITIRGEPPWLRDDC